MNKKQILFDLINNNQVDGCSILGIPTAQLQEYMTRGKDIMSLFKQNNIEIPFELDCDGFEHTFINVYMSHTNRNIYSINISNKVNITTELIDKIINTFFIEVIEIYQFDILPRHIDMILDSDFETLKFEDILMYINRNLQQKDIALKLNISQQLITELKKERKNMSIQTFSSFVSNYPLLPWFEYLSRL